MEQPAASEDGAAATEGSANPAADVPAPTEALGEAVPEADADGEPDAQGKGNRFNKTLEQMMSLKPGDDERTQISKKVSWILRHGAKKVDIEIDDEGWVNMTDLLGSNILQGVEEWRLMECVNESNVQKPRYEVRETESGKSIRAVGKHTIAGMTMTVNREQRNINNRRRDGGGGKGGSGGGNRDTGPSDHQTINAIGDFDGSGTREPGGWRRPHPGLAAHAPPTSAEVPPDEMTFEQQLEDGFRPVYQGERVLAMIRGGETVKAGRKGNNATFDRGIGRGDFKGKSEGGKAYGKGRPGQDDGFAFNAGLASAGTYSDRGFGSHDGVSFGDDGKGLKGRGKDSRAHWHGAGKSDRGGGGPHTWICQRGQAAIVRATQNIESAMVGTVHAGQLVTQTGAEVTTSHGIKRMPVEFLNEGGEVMRGWVTTTAEAANGPIYFRPTGGCLDDGAGSSMPHGEFLGGSSYGGGAGFGGGVRGAYAKGPQEDFGYGGCPCGYAKGKGSWDGRL